MLTNPLNLSFNDRKIILHIQILNCPIIVGELRPTDFTYGQYNQVQDLDVDERNGYVYVAYEHAIKVLTRPANSYGSLILSRLK